MAHLGGTLRLSAKAAAFVLDPESSLPELPEFRVSTHGKLCAAGLPAARCGQTRQNACEMTKIAVTCCRRIWETFVCSWVSYRRKAPVRVLSGNHVNSSWRMEQNEDGQYCQSALPADCIVDGHCLMWPEATAGALTGRRTSVNRGKPSHPFCKTVRCGISAW